MENLTFQSKLELNNKVKIPVMGFGVAEIAEELKTQVRILSEAIEAGYRMFDTAQIYRSERALGIAIKESGIPREEFFISTKIFEQQRYGRTTESVFESLKKMEIDYLDRFVLHWPIAGRYIQSYNEMEKLYYSGIIRSLGVSNFEIWHLKNLLLHSDVIPVTNQVEFNPSYTCGEQRAFCEKLGIYMEAYTPVGRGGRFMKTEPLVSIAGKYGKSVPQIILRWDIQHNVIPVPRSSQKAHMVENADIFDFCLSRDEMKLIDDINRDDRRNTDPYTTE